MITFVCGQLCSGKTFYSKALSVVCNGVYVEVGDIIRALKGSHDRTVLQDTKELSTKIIETIDLMAKMHAGKDLIVSGVRQKKVLESFPDEPKIWIECPSYIRKERYIYRDRLGDEQSFDEAEQGDIDLGILEVKQYIFSR